MALTSLDLPAGPEALDWIDRRAAAAARTWTVAQRTHPGDVAWGAAQHDQGSCRRRVWVEEDELRAWATVELLPGGEAYADIHLGSDRGGLRGDAHRQVVDFALSHASTTLVAVLDRERHLTEACLERGARDQDGPWFTHLLTDFTDAASRRRPLLPEGYRIRPVREDEISERVQVHRRAWSPTRIKRLIGVEPDDDEGESTFDLQAYQRICATSLYRRDLDLVVETPDGGLAASALGWYDPVSRSGLIEPVGTDPAYSAQGLARAACSELLSVMAGAGAKVALVCPRGDDGYPVPARLYRSLGMRAVARTRVLRIERG